MLICNILEGLERLAPFFFLIFTFYNWLMQLVLANPVGSVMEKLHQSNILDSFGLKGVYLTVAEAVADISSSWKAQP